jgi:hypothetical protein
MCVMYSVGHAGREPHETISFLWFRRSCTSTSEYELPYSTLGYSYSCVENSTERERGLKAFCAAGAVTCFDALLPTQYALCWAMHNYPLGVRVMDLCTEYKGYRGFCTYPPTLGTL